MFLLISPDHFGDAVVTVTAHAALYVRIQHIFGFAPNAVLDLLDRIMTGASRAKAVAVNLSGGVTSSTRLQNRAC